MSFIASGNCSKLLLEAKYCICYRKNSHHQYEKLVELN